jgi:plastocyanin
MCHRFFSRITLLTVMTPFVVCFGVSAASISGTITYDGKVPTLRPIKTDADPQCHASHDEPVPNEVLVLGDGNTMANVFVQVTNPPKKDYPVPSEAVVLDQKGCRYRPHVQGVMAGQTLKILNSDGFMHNVHALPKVNREFNMAMPGSRTEAEQTFSKTETMFAIKCDVHPWMKAYLAVLGHPFFAVTGTDGGFTIPDLPDGTYEIEAWHEKLGTRTATVTVKGADVTGTDFTFSRP